MNPKHVSNVAAPEPERFAYLVPVAEAVPPGLLSIADAARWFGNTSPRTIAEWIRQGRIAKVQVTEGGRVAIRIADLEAFALAHRTPAAPTHIHPLRKAD